MRICFIVNSGKDKRMGLFYAAHNRMKQFQKNGHEIEVLSFQKYHSKFIALLRKALHVKVLRANADFFTYEHVTYRYCWYKETLVSYFLEKLSIPRFRFSSFAKKKVQELLQPPFDVVYAHWGLECGLLAKEVSALLHVPYVVCYHGSDIHSTPRVWQPVIKTVLAQSAANIFVSKALQRSATNRYGAREQDCVIYNGIDSTVFRNKRNDSEIKELKALLGLKEKVVGFVGNLEPIKNADLLPELFYQIKKRNEDAQFVIVGDGSLRSKIEKEFLEKKLNVVFVGRVPTLHTANLMNIIDVLLLPSKQEGYPLALVEAAACGCYCVASKVGGIEEILPPDCLVDISNKSVFLHHFVEKIHHHLQNPQKLDLLTSYSWEEIYNQESQILNNIICDANIHHNTHTQ